MAPPETSRIVILAERNRHIRELLARELALSGFTVEQCGSGREALRLAEARCDLLVADCELPDMGAPDLIRAARLLRPDLQVAVHAHAPEDAGPCLEVPRVFFVRRDDDPAGLAREVRRILGDSAMDQPGRTRRMRRIRRTGRLGRPVRDGRSG